MKRTLTGLLAAIALAVPVAAPAVAPASPPAGASIAVAAKSCSSGYTHAAINGAEKCLRRGQYCAHAADRQYRKYGFRCIKRDSQGSYHLT